MYSVQCVILCAKLTIHFRPINPSIKAVHLSSLSLLEMCFMIVTDSQETKTIIISLLFVLY